MDGEVSGDLEWLRPPEDSFQFATSVQKSLVKFAPFDFIQKTVKKPTPLSNTKLAGPDWINRGISMHFGGAGVSDFKFVFM